MSRFQKVFAITIAGLIAGLYIAAIIDHGLIDLAKSVVPFGTIVLSAVFGSATVNIVADAIKARKDVS